MTLNDVNMKKGILLFNILIFIFTMVLFVGCESRLNGDLTKVAPSKLYTVEELILESSQQKTKITEEFVVAVEGIVHETKTIKSGDSIVIKGLLKGVLTDVIMLNCVVIKTK
jgi:hypothetical protein